MTIIHIHNIKDFMHRMLRTELFDHFLLTEATIRGRVSYVIDGHIVKESFSAEELEAEQLENLSCMPYAQLRENCYSLIKGKHTPSYFKFVFQLSPENLERTLAAGKSALSSSDLNAVFLNIRFQDGMLTCTSGVSYHNFVMDRTFEQEWDALVYRFFLSHDIACTQIQ
ncbi:MAG: hypothetical protein IJ567_10325 [Lachnospiraceae bacterium]|nr:hypothetical protein [Lachnospiraceae bacterium]